jgi:hypothetical protein
MDARGKLRIMRSLGSRQRASRARSAILLLAAAFAGACSAPPYYETAADFENAIRVMGVVGEHAGNAVAMLDSRGFKCAEPLENATTCQREADNVLCAQRQSVTLMTRRDNGRVSAFRIESSEAPDKLPHRCL